MASPRTFLSGLLVGATLAFAAIPCAIAATPSVGVALDTDDNAGTGCAIPTADGALAGVDLVVTARIVTTPTGAYVDRVERQSCSGGALGGPVVVDSGDWPVGLGAGSGGSAVVELSIPRSLLPRSGVAKAVAFASDGGSGADATTPFLISLAGTDGAGGVPVPVPFSPWLVLPLALLVGLAAVRLAHRHPDRARLAGVLFVFAFAGLAWAASGVVRDGAIGDWSGIAQAVGDPAGDGSPNADIVAVFVQGDDANLHLRIDADVRADDGGTGNLAPNVSAGPGQTITLPAGAMLSGSASDDGLPASPGTLTTAWTLVSGPSTVSFADAASPSTTATFAAPGTFVLRLTASDGQLAASATTTITVLDGPPQLAAIADRTIELGTRLQIVLEAKDGNAGDALAFSLPTAPAGAALRPAPLVDWMPTAGQLGTHPFTVRVADGSGASASRSFNVTVVRTNHAPTIAPQANEVVRGGATFARRVIASDPDEGDTLTLMLVAGPPGMTVSGNELSWPTAGATPGDRTVTVRVRDAAGLADQATFTLTLLPAAAPVAVDDTYEVRVGQTLVVPAAGVLANDNNPSSGPMSAVKKTDPALGTLSGFDADGAFTFEAPATDPAPAFGVAEAWRNDVSGQVVYSFPLVGDVNADGYPDLLLNHQGGTRAVDGRTGATLWDMNGAGYPDCTFVATSTAPVLADIDDDGVLEYVGALAGCERDSNVNTPGYAPQDRIVALDTTTGLVKWLSPRISASLGDVLAPGAPPSTEDRFQHVFAGAAFAAPHVARLAVGAMPTLLIRKTIRTGDGSYQPVTGPARSAGCRALTGLPADDGRACRATVLMSGVDGAVQQMLIAPNPANTSQDSWDPSRELAPFTVDVDGDGVPEIVSGSDVWKNVGGTWTLLWQSELEPIQALAADLDGDGRPEIVHVHAMDKTGSGASPRGQFGGDLYKFNGLLILDGATGVEKRRIRLPTYWTAWLTIADLDGDGAPEFVWNTQGRVYAVGTDGRIRWTYQFIPGQIGIDPASYSGVANVQVYDLDGDGVPEVVTNSHSEIVILNGRTGGVRQSIPSAGRHGGYYTAHDLQLVDADNDGHVDILATNVSGPDRYSYLMLRGAPNTWLPGPKIHPQVNFVNGDFSGNGHVEFNAGVPTQFRNPAQQGTVGDPRETEGASFTYAIDDGSGETAPATVFVAIKPANLPPVITSTAPTGLLQRFDPSQPSGLHTNVYQVTAVDPDPGDTLTWSLVSPPAWVTMDANGLIRFEPTCGSYGYPCPWGWTFVVARVTDSQGASAEQSFMVNLTTDAASVPDVVGQLLPDANAAIAAAGLDPQVLQNVADASPAGTVLSQDPMAGAANIAPGASVWLTVSKGPQPVPVPFVVGKTLAQANALIGAVGLTTIVSTVYSPTVPAGDVTAQSPDFGTMLLPGSAPPVALTVSAGAPLAKPVAQVVVEPGPGPLARLAGETQAFKATVVFDDGTSANVTYAATWLSTAPAIASVDATGVALAKIAGNATVSATIGGKTGQVQIAVSALALGDATPPTATIDAPVGGASVNGPVDVTGTATDPNFLRYELAFALAGDETWTVIGEGTSPVVGGVLGTFDPTVLVNDLYTLRLRVFDKGENVTEASVTVQAAGQRKIGLFTLSYRDLNVAAAGIPLTVTRTYDSRDKTSRDFGFGWRLGLDTLRIRANRVLGTGWVRQVSGPTVSLVPTSEHRVSVTLPDGRVEVFDMVVAPTSNLGSLDFTSVAGFVARPGTRGSLEALANPDLLIVNGGAFDELVDDTTLDTYSPKLYRYTTVEGMSIELGPSVGVTKVTDANGTTVTFGPDGILHSDGSGIAFARDAKGRIVAITDPNGGTQSYAYDGNGDLVEHVDATGASSRYAYDRRHGLIEAYDARGVRSMRNDYDDQGRLVSITDGEGHTITYGRTPGVDEEVVTDRLGRQSRYAYDTQGNVTRAERVVTIEGTPVLTVSTWEYDADGNETVRVDPDGLRREATFDNLVPTRIAFDPAGVNLVSTYAFDARRLLGSATDPAGKTATFAYDANGNPTSASIPGAGTLTFVHDANGLPIERRNALGTKVVSTRDARGRVVRDEVFDAGSALLLRVDQAWDANGNRLSETQFRTMDGVLTALTTSYAYDAAGRLVKVTDPAGGTRRIEYDAVGHVTARVDALGRRTAYEYDAIGRLVRTAYPDGTTETQVYDAEGNLLSRTDAAGRLTSWEYDELGRVVRKTRPAGATTRTIYTAGGRVAATIDPLGQRNDFAYDSAGRRTTVVEPAVADGPGGPLVRPTWTTAWNPDGQPASVTDPYGRVTSYVYDAEGRRIRTIHPDGTQVQTSWDTASRRIGAVNEEGQATTYAYDALGRVVSVTGLDGDATYAYDEAGNRVVQTDALGRTTRFRYDALGRMLERRYPGGAKQSQAYDAVGNVVARTDGLGRVTTITYDAMDRQVATILPGGATLAWTYAPDGRRVSAADERGVTTYAYDAEGRIAAIAHPGGEVVSYVHDAADRLVSIAPPSGATAYVYDALGRLVTVTAPEGAHVAAYDLLGNRVRRVDPNGIVTDATLDMRYRPVLSTQQTAGGTALGSWTIGYTAAGRRSSVTALDGSVETWTYDAKGRVVAETRTGAGARSASYAYDAAGNRTVAVRDGVPTTYAYDNDDRMISEGPATWTWDANGHPVARTQGAATTQYGFDPLGRLASIVGAATNVQYGYDADGRRVQATSPFGVVRFLVDARNPSGHSQVLEERDGGAALAARYVVGEAVLAATRGGSTTFALDDPFGNVHALADAGGASIAAYRYDAFGVPTHVAGDPAFPYRYRGERLDATGDYHLRARQYEPSAGRFLSRDPHPGDPMRPNTLHRYQYAGADPVNRIDPSGEMDLPQLSTAMQITVTLATVHSAVVFGGEFYQTRVLGTAALAAVTTFATDVVMAAGSEFLFARFLAPVAGKVGAWMAPGMSKLSSAIGEAIGIGGATTAELLGAAAAKEYYAVAKLIASVFDELSGSLAAKAGGKVLGETSTKAIEAGRLKIANAVFRLSPEARRYLKSQLAKWADPAAFSTLPGGYTVVELGAWKELIAILKEIV